MKTATVRDLRNNFSRLSKWLDRGEPIEILKRGKPIAELVPKRGSRKHALLGATPSPHPLPSDLDQPIAAEWDALK